MVICRYGLDDFILKSILSRSVRLLDYVAEYNLAGGSIYNSPFISSVPPGISPTAAQTDPNLHWASSHSNDQSGYYNWYVLTGENNDTYNPNAKKLFDDVFFKLGHPGYGYHLPSRWGVDGRFLLQR